MRVRIWLLCLLLLTAACTGDTPTPGAFPSPQPPASVVVAVDNHVSGVELYRIGLDRQAVKITSIKRAEKADHWYEPDVVALSSGERPTTCVVWREHDYAASIDAEPTRSLWCYEFGDQVGQQVVDLAQPGFALSLQADGRALAWGTQHPGYGQEVLIGDLHGDGVVIRERHRVTSAKGTPFSCKGTLRSVLWTDADHLLLTCSVGYDDPTELVVQSVAGDAPGRALSVRNQAPYNSLKEVRSADADGAWGVQTQECGSKCPGQVAPSRAVRFSLETGAVTEVVSTAAPNRYMVAVSGGSVAVLYVTGGGRKGAKPYLRFPGEKHGTAVEGLPTGMSIDEGYYIQP